MTRKQGFTVIELLVVAAILVLLVTVVSGLFGSGDGNNAWTESSLTITVNDKYVVPQDTGNCYRIETTKDDGEDEVLQIVDTLFDGQLNSADLFAKLKRGHTYEVSCRGYRSGAWSSFRNIIQVVREIPNE